MARGIIRKINRASTSKLKNMILLQLRSKRDKQLASLRRRKLAKLRRLYQKTVKAKLNRIKRNYLSKLKKAYQKQAHLRRKEYQNHLNYLNTKRNTNKSRMLRIITKRRKTEQRRFARRLRNVRKTIRKIKREFAKEKSRLIQEYKKRYRERNKQIRKASQRKLNKMTFKRLSRARYVSHRRSMLIHLRRRLISRAKRISLRDIRRKKRTARRTNREDTRSFIRMLQQCSREKRSQMRYFEHSKRISAKVCSLSVKRLLSINERNAQRRLIKEQNNLNQEWKNKRKFIKERLRRQTNEIKKALRARVNTIRHSGYYRLKRMKLEHLAPRRAYNEIKRTKMLRSKVLKKVRRRAIQDKNKLLRKAKDWITKHRNIQRNIQKRNAQRMQKAQRSMIGQIQRLMYRRSLFRAQLLRKRLTRYLQHVRRLQRCHQIKLENVYHDLNYQIRAQVFSIRRQLRIVTGKIWLQTDDYLIRRYGRIRFSISKYLRRKLRYPKEQLQNLNKSLRQLRVLKNIGKKRQDIQHVAELDRADYYWNFNQQINGQTIDMAHKQPAVLFGGAEIDTNRQGEKIASTVDSYGWISLGDFAGKCFSDPGLCRSHGLTILTRLKLDKDNIHTKPSAYILSSGGQTTKARGFALLRLAKKYILILSTKDRQWKLETEEMPDGWFNLGITWQNNKLLKLFINGKTVASSEAIKVSRPVDSFTSFDVGRPNNSPSSRHRMPMSIHSIALWEKGLTDQTMKQIQHGMEDNNGD